MRGFVEIVAEELGAAVDAVHDAALATDEAVCNIIGHGYAGESGQIELCVERSGRDLLVRIRDQAPAFDPTAYPAPDLTVPLEQRRPGGFGIYLMRRVMDDVSYRSMPDGRNELLLVRRSAFDREST
jgi:anti-sigma regulatory factor (Ser/Thr protein kinase)